jgi:hypothetical protein
MGKFVITEEEKKHILGLYEQTEKPQMLSPNDINTLMPTTSDDGVEGMLKNGILSYTDESGKNIQIDFSSVPGSKGISNSGMVNVDTVSTLFGYTNEYNVSLVDSPSRMGMAVGTSIEDILDNSSNKFIQFYDKANEEDAIVFIKTKKGFEMKYLQFYKK